MAKRALATTDQIRGLLTQKETELKTLLPEQVRGDADRFIARAALYYSQRPELTDCTRESKIEAFLSAAELGLPLDGRLCHVVKYGNKATLMVDYKGLVVVARRGPLKDVSAHLVYEKDEISIRQTSNGEILEHDYDPFGDRGELRGVYARLVFQDGTRRHEPMSLDEVNRARACARNDKIWRDWFEEMAKKTAIRRALKLFCDDPQVSRAMDFEEEEFKEPPRKVEAKPDYSFHNTPRKMESGGGYISKEPPATVADEKKAAAAAVDLEHAKIHAECATLIGQLKGYDVDLSRIVPESLPMEEMSLQEIQDLREILQGRLREEKVRTEKK